MQLRQLRAEATDKILLYHAGPASIVETIKTDGLIAVKSESPQKGVYLALRPEIALATAEGRNCGMLLLAVVRASFVDEFHPDDDIFDFSEVLEGIDLTKVFITNKSDSFIRRKIGVINSATIAKNLLVNLREIKDSCSIIGNVVYYDDISWSGSPKLVGIGVYKLIDGHWAIQTSFGNDIPKTIKRL